MRTIEYALLAALISVAVMLSLAMSGGTNLSRIYGALTHSAP